jgi:hypothetical protein
MFPNHTAVRFEASMTSTFQWDKDTIYRLFDVENTSICDSTPSDKVRHIRSGFRTLDSSTSARTSYFPIRWGDDQCP